MIFTIKHFHLRYLRSSSDYRTNVWEVECKVCKVSYIPVSTMMALQTLQCPKCGITEIVNYNELDDERSI